METPPLRDRSAALEPAPSSGEGRSATATASRPVPGFLRIPVALSAAILLAAIVSTFPLRDLVTRDPVPGVRLGLPTDYLLTAPVSGLLDALSLLSVRQTLALISGTFLAYAVSRAARLRASRPRWRRESGLAGVLAGLVLLAYATLLAVHRPMAFLVVDDPDVVAVDFHSHTDASWDGRAGFTADRNRDWHRDAGFDAAYVTDHRSLDGAASGARGNPRVAGEGVVLLSGVEKSISQVQVNALSNDSMLIVTLPAPWKDLARLEAKPLQGLVGIEIVDGAPRGIDQSQRDRPGILALADRLNLAVVGGSNIHGWGRSAIAWNLMRIPGWRSMTPEVLGSSIERSLREDRRHAVTVVGRRSPDPGDSNLALALTAPAFAIELLRSLSTAERWVWLAWIWGLAGMTHLASRAGVFRLREREPSPPPRRALLASLRGREGRAALAITAGAAMVRLLMAARIPLIPDETYYWEWSRRLAAGYFDHAPAIAFLIAAGTRLLGASALGVRFVPIVCGFATSVVVVRLASRFGGDRAALRAAVILACLPLASAGLILATPDSPLLLTTALALGALVQAIESPEGGPRSALWWATAGALTGAAFLSKYTAVLLPLGVLAALATAAPLRRKLLTAGPLLASLSAIVVASPVILWNARNDWVSFRFQLGHGLAGSSHGSALGREAALLAGQAALASPILLGLLVLAVAQALRRHSGDGRFLLAVIAAVTFLFFILSALRKPVAPNWTAPAFVPAVALVAAAAGRDAWRPWLRAGCALGGALTFVVCVHAVTGVIPIGPRSDPTAQAFGWEALARRVDAVAGASERDGGGTAWLGADGYQDASELAFGVPRHPIVFSLNLAGRRNQYDLWPGFPGSARAGDILVFVSSKRLGEDPAVKLLAPHFEGVGRGEPIELESRHKVVRRRVIYVLKGWKGTWPAAASTSRPGGSLPRS